MRFPLRLGVPSLFRGRRAGKASPRSLAVQRLAWDRTSAMPDISPVEFTSTPSPVNFFLGFGCACVAFSWILRTALPRGKPFRIPMVEFDIGN